MVNSRLCNRVYIRKTYFPENPLNNHINEEIMSEQSAPGHFPYTSQLDFGPLLTFWENNLTGENGLQEHPVARILQNKKTVRDLQGAVTEKHIERYKEEIGLLLSAIIPPALLEQEMVAVHIPFKDNAFFSTEKYKDILRRQTKSPGQISMSGADGDLGDNCEVIAGLYILKNFYKPDLQLDLPVIVNTKENENGLEKVYKMEVNTQFAEIEVVGGLPEISDDTIEELLNNFHDHELWKKHLPPENFIFKGFTINRLTDVTAQEMLSSIKYYLLKRDAVTCGTNFLTIQEKIRSLFSLPELKLGIVFFDEDYNIISNAGLSEWNSFLNSCDCKEVACATFQGSVYDKVFHSGKSVIIEDLQSYPSKSEIENGLLESGVRSFAIAPLISNGKILGMLEVASPVPGKLNNMNASKLVSVLPMFTAAIQRVLGDLQVEVRALIQKECTAIHPSVEWKFIEEGFKLIRNKSAKGIKEMPQIVFENVYPLFGMSDIRNSSVYRNASIREDLVTNLKAARQVLTTLYHHKQMDIFNELGFRVDKALDHIKSGLASGDESNILEFIRGDVNHALEFYREAEPETAKSIQGYFDKLDPEFGVVYNRRRAFEESLTRINEAISNHIDEAEKVAQDIFPHYFEKYKTDGVEFNIYVGDSITRERKFDKLYLRNLRLWQLVLMTQIAEKIHKLRDDLPHPLEITQLILIQNESLDIRFRKDEKHFDVDGAYNIRYEIIKKRIDKAFIKGTSERLTQPGKISIVYSHEKEAEEYLQYIEYMKASDRLSGEVEFLELEDVQGAHGLRALRVTVNMETIGSGNSMGLEEQIQEVLNQ